LQLFDFTLVHFIHPYPSSVYTRLYSFIFTEVHFPALPLFERTRPSAQPPRSHSNSSALRHSHFAVIPSHPMSFVCCLLVRISFVLSFFHHSGTFPLIVTHVCHPHRLGSSEPSTFTYYFALPYFSSP